MISIEVTNTNDMQLVHCQRFWDRIGRASRIVSHIGESHSTLKTDSLSGIGHIKGALQSWKYEFLIIGALCASWGIVLFIFLPDSPVNARLLNQRQRRIAVERLRENQTGVENKQFKFYQVKEAFLDYKLYLLFFLAVVGNIPNGG